MRCSGCTLSQSLRDFIFASAVNKNTTGTRIQLAVLKKSASRDSTRLRMIVATVEVFRIGGIRLVSDEKEDARKTKKMKIEEKSGKRGSYIAGGREGSETAANFVRRCWEPGVVEMVCEEVKCDHLVSLLSISADERESGGILNKREEEEQKRDRQQMPAVGLKTTQNDSKRQNEFVRARSLLSMRSRSWLHLPDPQVFHFHSDHKHNPAVRSSLFSMRSTSSAHLLFSMHYRRY